MSTTLNSPLLIFFILNLILIPSFCCPLQQKQALLNFKSNILHIDPKYNDWYPFKSWNSISDCCLWHSVICGTTKTVIEIDLQSFNSSLSFSTLSPLFCIRSLEVLDISHKGLAGPIPKDVFGNLTKLVHLDMLGNYISGPFPDQIFGLTNLRYLNMRNNSFEGSLSPEVGKLQNLESLILDRNLFTGNIPEEIGNLTKLRLFSLQKNKFSGRIPSSIANLKDLELLYFSENSFSMQIPSSIHNLTKLRRLHLEDNKLTGEFPTSIFNITSLESLYIGGEGSGKIWNNKAKIVPRGNLIEISIRSCGISGQIPKWISSQKGLYHLDLSGNELEGRFPYWLAEMELKTIILFDNKLTGSIPPRLFESKRLMILHLSHNTFSGELPQNIGNADGIFSLILSTNNFFGKIPISISDMNSLIHLDLSINKFSGNNFPALTCPYFSFLVLSYNMFSGKIPTNFSRKAKVLRLGGNKFSGNLPSKLTEFFDLELLDLHDNNITGGIEYALSLSPNLKILVLRNNSFEGFIPTTISNFPNLQILDLSGNKLKGSIPPEIANLTRMIKAAKMLRYNVYIMYNKEMLDYVRFEIHIEDLIMNWKNYLDGLSSQSLDMYTILDLSNNRLSGKIPASLGKLKFLKLLNISNNNISGYIPNSFGDLKEIECLDLSHNKISGSIPQSLAKLGALAILDVSNNKLTGKIPLGGQMDTMDELKYFANNSRLCGMQINITCPEDIPPLEGREEVEDDEQLSWIFWVGTSIGFPIGFFSSILVMGYFLNFLLLFKL